MNVFVYGSLMVPAVWKAVTGVSRPGVPALLQGYARHALWGEVFPGVTEVSGAATVGLLRDNISPSLFEKLDQFEGDGYLRRTVSVMLVRGTMVSAEIYVLTGALRRQSRPVAWDFEEFVQERRWELLL